jgi:hypothetical protein
VLEAVELLEIAVWSGVGRQGMNWGEVEDDD